MLEELGLTLPGGNKPEPLRLCRAADRDRRPSGCRNAANHAAAFDEAGGLRSGKPRPLWPGAESYAHFTSPIRRYPDLSLHRAIKYLLAKEEGSKGNTTPTGGYHYDMEEMLQLGQHCSMTERRADEATRDVADWLKCDFMLDQVGNVFTGVISSVTGFGFFVRLMSCLLMVWYMSPRWTTITIVSIRWDSV